MWLKVFNLKSKFSPADSTRPPSLDYGQILIIKQFSPADSSGHTRPPYMWLKVFNLESKFSPVDSGGLHQTPFSGLWSNCNYKTVQSGGLRQTPPDPLLWTMVKF